MTEIYADHITFPSTTWERVIILQIRANPFDPSNPWSITLRFSG